MDQKVKVDQIPSEADQLYIQLYCERKGENDEATLEEARKSWMSLSESKKNLFYKSIADRNLTIFAHRLSNTKIYMKEKASTVPDKHSSGPQNEDVSLSEPEQHLTVQSINESNLSDIVLQPSDESGNNNHDVSQLSEDQCQSNNDNPINYTKVEVCNETEETNVRSPLYERSHSSIQFDDIANRLETQSNSSSLQRSIIPLIEPSPPTVKRGLDLYGIVKRPDQPDWKCLTDRERSPYNNAVRVLKREYILNYMTYLESLSQKELFEHYRRTFH